MDKIQERISSGKKVVIKKAMGVKISVRFNNKDIDGLTKWIILIDGEQIYVAEIKLKIKLFTETYHIDDVGLKHHLSGYAKKIKIKKNIAYIK